MLIACRSFNCICAFWSVASHHVCLHNFQSMTSACQCHPTGVSNSAHWQWCVTCSLWSVRVCKCASARVGGSVLHHSWMIRHFSCWFICVLRALTPCHPWGMSAWKRRHGMCVCGLASKRKGKAEGCLQTPLCSVREIWAIRDMS